jgi:uncharacterized protein
MDYMRLKLTEFKSLDDTPGVFEGYLAVYNNRDHGGDIILPGAFTKTLKDKKGKVPLLDSHDSGRRLGLLELEDDAKGLKVKRGVINLNKQAGVDAYSDLKFYSENDVSLGLSIGYDTIKRDFITEKDGTISRHLKELALWEGSLVTFPMNPKAKVTRVKEMAEDLASSIDSETARTLIEAIKSVLKPEEIKALLDGEAASKDSDPAAKAQESETTIDIDFWRNIKNERRTK